MRIYPSNGLAVTVWAICFSLLFSMKVNTRMVDLRSDTVTRPTAAMRSAMFEAEVGDDVFGDDPTILKLEKKMSNIFDKESALFFPSGTMSNLAATMSWCGTRGSEMILGGSSHMFLYEQGGISQLAGVLPRCLENQRDGVVNLDRIERAVRQSNIHFPVTECIALENTHNFCGGRVLPKGYLEAVGQFAKSRDINVHLDGARIWNAATASQTPLNEIVRGADSVSVCLSKGLGAPSGSVLLGPSDFIERARRSRKALGGGMRQVGILAAAGLQGITDFEAGVLLPDHAKARVLAAAIADIPGFTVALDSVETNIVLINTNSNSPDPASIVGMLKERNVLVLAFGEGLRLVTHRDILDADVEVIIAAFRSLPMNVQSDVKMPIPAILYDARNAPQEVTPVAPATVAAAAAVPLTQTPTQTPTQSPIEVIELTTAAVPTYEEYEEPMSIIREALQQTDSTKALIQRILLNEDIFRPLLSQREIDEIVDGAEGIKVAPGDTVIIQGDSAEYFYIIESGRVDRVSADKSGSPVWESLTGGGYFGEIALIYDVPRSATVVAVEETLLWRIHKRHFFFVCKALDSQIGYLEAHAVKAKDSTPDTPTLDRTPDRTPAEIHREIVRETRLVDPAEGVLLCEITRVALESVERPIEKVFSEIERVIVDTLIEPISKQILSAFGESEEESPIVRGSSDGIQVDIEALRAWELLEIDRAERRHAEVPVKDVPAKGEDEDIQYYEEAVIHGMSLSDDGFCVLLKGVVCERVLRVLVTPEDPMSDGLDRDQVDTSEAVTLLQLLQGIDVESVLSRDALAVNFAESGPGRHQYVLQRVMIDNVDSSKMFHARLHGSAPPSGTHPAPPLVDVSLPVSVLPQHSFDYPLLETLVHLPPAVATPTLSPAQEELLSSSSSEALPLNIPIQPLYDGGRVNKEVEIDSAFEAIALALRHSAVVEVLSSLLQDEHFSYSLDELPSFFPKLVKSDIALEDRGRFGADYDARSEMERLQRRLYEAIRQGNTDKIDPIKRQLEFHSHIEGRSVLVLPPPHVSLAPVIDVEVISQQERSDNISMLE